MNELEIQAQSEETAHGRVRPCHDPSEVDNLEPLERRRHGGRRKPSATAWEPRYTLPTQCQHAYGLWKRVRERDGLRFPAEIGSDLKPQADQAPHQKMRLIISDVAIIEGPIGKARRSALAKTT